MKPAAACPAPVLIPAPAPCSYARRAATQARRQRGAAAVEAAILLPILIAFLTMPVFYAKCLWHYTVAQKAAQDATRYLASVPKAEMSSALLATAAGNRAADIATKEIAELAPGGEILLPTAYCSNATSTALCGRLIPITSLPTHVRVDLAFIMADPLFELDFFGTISINASATMSYVGN